MRQGILIVRGDGRRVRDQALLDADHRHGLELQALHGVHSAGPDARRTAPAADRGGVEAIRFERLAGLPHQASGSGRNPDGARLRSGRQPRADPFGKESEFLGPGGGVAHLRSLAVHRGSVAEQGVDLTVQAGDGVGAEQRHRPGQDLLGGAVVQGQLPAPPPDADPQAGQGDPVAVDALVRVGRDEQVVRAFGYGRSEQPPLRGVQVLGLVHQDVPVARRACSPGAGAWPRWPAADAWTGGQRPAPQ